MMLEDQEITVGGSTEVVTAEDKALIKESVQSLPVEKHDTETETAAEEDESLGAEHDDKTDEERDAIRERRRNERQNKKKFRNDKEDSYKREIESLKRQVGDMNEWKNTVEQRRVHSGVAQLDKSLKDSINAIEIAKRAISAATSTQDGDALVDAQELYYAARKRVDELSRVRQQLAQRAGRPPQQNIDPSIVRQAQGWMEDKPWYDPSGKDADSRIALTIDNTMAEEGWDPRTPEYWGELDGRLQKYLPHRYNMSYTKNRGDATRPPTGGSSQSQGSAGSSNFTLSSERVRAMKEAGMWDDADKRKSMVRRYMEQDRNSKS